MSKTIKADIDYVSGHLRYAHYELELDDDEIEEFSKLSEKDKKEWIRDEGELIIDDYTINDIGSITKIHE